ncbi:hypothetical protein OSB04_un001663 [Centaurea solstitialis]|uniref:Uncharacterized protein n=1 Tax=Centaurea solstitialis TaxID=347529 RepID=A0AA38SFR8_9ASTR|nr:hypothetical protein OSB04_un001663 [Centaurea solstitialis]
MSFHRASPPSSAQSLPLFGPGRNLPDKGNFSLLRTVMLRPAVPPGFSVAGPPVISHHFLDLPALGRLPPIQGFYDFGETCFFGKHRPGWSRDPFCEEAPFSPRIYGLFLPRVVRPPGYSLLPPWWVSGTGTLLLKGSSFSWSRAGVTSAPVPLVHELGSRHFPTPSYPKKQGPPLTPCRKTIFRLTSSPSLGTKKGEYRNFHLFDNHPGWVLTEMPYEDRFRYGSGGSLNNPLPMIPPALSSTGTRSSPGVSRAPCYRSERKLVALGYGLSPSGAAFPFSLAHEFVLLSHNPRFPRFGAAPISLPATRESLLLFFPLATKVSVRQVVSCLPRDSAAFENLNPFGNLRYAYFNPQSFLVLHPLPRLGGAWVFHRNPFLV